VEKKTKRYRVLENRRTAKTIVALKLAPEDGEVFAFKAGQFVMLRLLNPDGTMWRAKAYSVCSPPSERSHIELGFKIQGPFTQRAATSSRSTKHPPILKSRFLQAGSASPLSIA